MFSMRMVWFGLYFWMISFWMCRIDCGLMLRYLWWSYWNCCRVILYDLFNLLLFVVILLLWWCWIWILYIGFLVFLIVVDLIWVWLIFWRLILLVRLKNFYVMIICGNGRVRRRILVVVSLGICLVIFEWFIENLNFMEYFLRSLRSMCLLCIFFVYLWMRLLFLWLKCFWNYGMWCIWVFSMLKRLMSILCGWIDLNLMIGFCWFCGFLYFIEMIWGWCLIFFVILSVLVIWCWFGRLGWMVELNDFLCWL